MDRLDTVKEFIETAKLCLDAGKFRSAVSRSYYAVFHACIALFEFYHYTPSNFIGRNGRPATRWEHGIITKYALLEFVHKRNLMHWVTAAQIKRLYRSRIEADYRSDMIITGALARNSYAEAVKIVTLIEGKVK